MTKALTYTAALLVALLLTGCGQHYVTPGAPVSMLEIAGKNLQAYTDSDLQAFYATRPVSPFPTNIVVVRVQDSGYHPHAHYSSGRYSVITTRDIENDNAFQTLLGMPDIQGIAPIGRMLAPDRANSVRDLRVPAAQLHADMLLVYTVETAFTIDGQQLGPLSVISLGLLPNRTAHVTATVSGILVDVRTGFIYGTTEASDTQDKRTSIWSTGLAIDTARIRAEKNAFVGFVAELEKLWPDVVLAHKGNAIAGRQDAAASRSGYHTVEFGDTSKAIGPAP